MSTDTLAVAGPFHPSRGTYRFVVLLIAGILTFGSYFAYDSIGALVDTLLNRTASVKAIRDGDAWKKVVTDWEQETQAFAARRKEFLRY